jgi:hypothetical protein
MRTQELAAAQRSIMSHINFYEVGKRTFHYLLATWFPPAAPHNIPNYSASWNRFLEKYNIEMVTENVKDKK